MLNKTEYNTNRLVLEYLSCVIEKSIKYRFSYSDKAGWDKVKEMSISLPIKTNENDDPIIDNTCFYHNDGFIPDWNYMQERIKKLEQERIKELEQYLIVTGLNDYKLTDEDKVMLATKLIKEECSQSLASEDSNLKKAFNFKISDVFDLHKGKRLTKANHTCGNTPFIGSTDSNNGVTGYIGQEPIFEGNAITVSYNGSVGQVFYQEKPFWASDDINVLYLKDHILNTSLYGYLSSVLKKAGSKFSYSYKWNLERMKKTMIVLPVQTDNNNMPIIDQNKTYHPNGYIPDWDYMEKYIHAIEKEVIRDVVEFKDKIIK